jgi:hypothetical protein
MERDSGSVTAAFHGCRSAAGADCAPADDRSSSLAGVCRRPCKSPARGAVRSGALPGGGARRWRLIMTRVPVCATASAHSAELVSIAVGGTPRPTGCGAGRSPRSPFPQQRTEQSVWVCAASAMIGLKLAVQATGSSPIQRAAGLSERRQRAPSARRLRVRVHRRVNGLWGAGEAPARTQRACYDGAATGTVDVLVRERRSRRVPPPGCWPHFVQSRVSPSS